MNKNNKKILMICESFGGGVFAYVTQLCNDMVDNFDIYLVYSTRPQTPKNYKEILDPRIHLIEIEHFDVSVNMIKNVRVIKKLRRIEQKIKPDIIHLHSSIAGGMGRLAFKNSEIPVVYTPHGYSFILMRSSVKTKAYKLMEKILGNISNSITLTCSESEDEVAGKLTKRHTYIETGIDLKRLSQSLSKIEAQDNKEKFTVFTLGRITGQKQPEVFNKIALLVPEAKFLWIGDGEDRKILTAPNIVITGWKGRNEALDIAKGADAYVLCSRGEAIAESLIENMYIKKVTLVSNVMGNKSVIQDGVNGYVCDTPEDYAKRIKEIMHSYPNNLVNNAYKDVKTIYNSDVMKIKYIDFYERL